MRRLVSIVALAAAFAIFATPARAQQTEDRWMLSAAVGPAFGTFGATPTVEVSAGARLSNRWSVVGEFGALPHAPFEKAATLVPGITPSADGHVNGYHINANLVAQPWSFRGAAPYLTGGVGTFTGEVPRDLLARPARTVDRTDTHFASNIGGGIAYRLNRWLGLNADYRHFVVNAADTEHVNRFAAGLALFVK